MTQGQRTLLGIAAILAIGYGLLPIFDVTVDKYFLLRLKGVYTQIGTGSDNLIALVAGLMVTAYLVLSKQRPSSSN